MERAFSRWSNRPVWQHLRNRLAFRRPDGERGSILVFACIATVLAVAATSLGVDLSKAVATKRKLQTIADLAALDAVQSLGSPPKAYTAQQLAKASLVSNGYNPVDTTPCSSYCVDVGMYPDPATGAFTVTADTTKQNAVRVTLRSTTAWAIAPGDKTYTATGIARVRSDAGIAIGSFLLRVDTTQSILDGVLGGMLGSAVSLDAVSYKGIASTQVTLGELRSGLNVSAGTPDALLNSDFKLADVLTATASALSAEGNPTAAATVNGMALAVNSGVNSNVKIKLGDMITVAQGGAAALSSQINAFQLVQGSIQLANKNHALTVALPLLGVPGLATVSADITVIEPPQIAIGPAKQVSGAWVTKATTSQITTTLHVNLLSLANVTVGLQAANGSAELRGITCATPPTLSHETLHTTTSALTAQLSTTLAGIGLVNTSTSVASTTSSPDLDYAGLPQDMSPGLAGQRFDWTFMKTVGAGAAGSTISSNLKAGGLLGAVINLALAPVFNLLDVLLDPLLASLGITLGGADVWAWDLNCNARTLVN